MNPWKKYIAKLVIFTSLQRGKWKMNQGTWQVHVNKSDNMSLIWWYDSGDNLLWVLKVLHTDKHTLYYVPVERHCAVNLSVKLSLNIMQKTICMRWDFHFLNHSL